MEYVLTTENLRKKFGSFEALKGLSMQIPKGSIYGLIGKNGAGKTTLIRLICGLQYPSGGNYSLFGCPNTSKELNTARKRMGAIIETPSIYPQLSAAENLKAQCDILGLGYHKIQELLELVGLSETGHKKAGKFSLGMRQRLGIAIALCGGAEFLVLDEPTNGLDPQGMADMRKLILQLNQEHGITFLISSHILDELSKIATHYGFVANGVLEKEVTSSEFEQLRQQAIRIHTDGTGDLAQALRALNIRHTLYTPTQADIKDPFTVTDLVLALHRHGIHILHLGELEENLEQFYFSVLGGEDHG